MRDLWRKVTGEPRLLLEADTLERMTDAMAHRGPNDRGIHLAPGIALGARLLSIIDVERGHQPFANETGTVWGVQKGELYNHVELRRGLEQAGHRFHTRAGGASGAAGSSDPAAHSPGGHEAQLRHELTQRLGLVCMQPVKGMAELQQVPGAAIRAFSTRRQSLVEHMEALVHTRLRRRASPHLQPVRRKSRSTCRDCASSGTRARPSTASAGASSVRGSRLKPPGSSIATCYPCRPTATAGAVRAALGLVLRAGAPAQSTATITHEGE